MAQGKDEEVVITLTRSTGSLSINKAYVDMGSNESNNTAGFSIRNIGSAEFTWSITNAARWITKIEPTTGAITANEADAVVFTIDRSKLSSNTIDNYATLVVRSSDGSAAELLVTVFSIGEGIDITSQDVVILQGANLMVLKQNIGTTNSYSTAASLCEGIRGGYGGWRLPTIAELSTLYIHRTEIGGFKSSWYWSSTSCSNDNYRTQFNFDNGTTDCKYTKAEVRCVRSLK
jgi:hypothetical protein